MKTNKKLEIFCKKFNINKVYYTNQIQHKNIEFLNIAEKTLFLKVFTKIWLQVI